MYFIIIAVGLGLVGLERLRPARDLPKANHWYQRVALINALQLGIVILGGYTWDIWLQRASLFSLADWPIWLSGGFAYLVLTFVYYWWHRARHRNMWLWNIFHQIHHSPKRIETLTSFYKHPLEIGANSIITGSVTYLLLGLPIEAAAFTTFYGAMAEFFYHMNLRTPHWVGYIFQRPEMHRIHHEMGKHNNNFADIPLWDMLFGTYENPKDREVRCGFKGDREDQWVGMLLGKNVNPGPLGAVAKPQPGQQTTKPMTRRS